MEMNRLTREADELIRKVVSRYNSLYSPTGNISQIELDLMLDDLRMMYEKFKAIGHLNMQHAQQEHTKVGLPQSAPARNLPQEPDPAPQQVSTQEFVQEEEVKPVEEMMQEEAAEAEPEPIEQAPEELFPATEAAAPQMEIQYSAEPTQVATEEPATTLADKFKTQQKSVSETFSADESLGSRLGHQSATDLKSLIGLADKFAFVNELFHGDALAYEKAIVQLNGATHLSEAEAYFKTLKLNHKWIADTPQEKLLIELIRRKFSAQY